MRASSVKKLEKYIPDSDIEIKEGMSDKEIKSARKRKWLSMSHFQRGKISRAANK